MKEIIEKTLDDFLTEVCRNPEMNKGINLITLKNTIHEYITCLNLSSDTNDSEDKVRFNEGTVSFDAGENFKVRESVAGKTLGNGSVSSELLDMAKEAISFAEWITQNGYQIDPTDATYYNNVDVKIEESMTAKELYNLIYKHL